MIPESLVRRSATPLGGSALGTLAGGALSLAGDVLEPLSYPQQALFWGLGKVNGAMGGDSSPITQDEIARTMGIDPENSPLMAALVGAATDPLTYTGFGAGRAAGRAAGRQIGAVDDTFNALRPFAKEAESLAAIAPDVQYGVEKQALLRSQGAAAAEAELASQQAARQVKFGDMAMQPEEAAAALADPNSPLAQAIASGQIPGMFQPKVGPKLSPLMDALEQYGYAGQVGGKPAVAYQGLPVMRRRGSSMQLTDAPLETLSDLPPGPFFPVRNPSPVPTMPPNAAPELSLRDVLFDPNSPGALTPGSAKFTSEGLSSLVPSGQYDDALLMAVDDAHRQMVGRRDAISGAATQAQQDIASMPAFGRWFAKNYGR